MRIEPVTPRFGAEIRDIQIRDGLTRGEIDGIYEALLDWKVLFFRDQEMKLEDHLAFGRLFGDLEVHPFATSDTGPNELVSILHDERSTAGQDTWHSDVSWLAEPSRAAILRARLVPPVGGDTLWADMEAAYDSLADDVKELLEGLTATHSFVDHFADRMTASERESALERFPEQHHPVVRTHPETARRSLYVNGFFTRCIDNTDQLESDRMLRELIRSPMDPRFQCRFRWQENSVAFWDNRSTQHYALFDYHPARRLVERVSIKGDRPF